MSRPGEGYDHRVSGECRLSNDAANESRTGISNRRRRHNQFERDSNKAHGARCYVASGQRNSRVSGSDQSGSSGVSSVSVALAVRMAIGGNDPSLARL